jgi:hypothetical protein
MRILLAFLLFVAAGAFITYDYYDVGYWMTPPEQRLSQKWEHEVAKEMKRSKKISKELQLLKEIQMTLTDPNFAGFIEKTKKPYLKSAKGIYLLHVEIIPSIEENVYGFDIQNEIFDTRDNNKVDEFSFTINVGRLW